MSFKYAVVLPRKVIVIRKVSLFAFNGEAGCFVHVMLHALDLSPKGFEAVIIIEGAAAGLIKDLEKAGKPYDTLYQELREKGLIECIWEVCARKAGTLGHAKGQGLRVANEIKRCPSMGKNPQILKLELSLWELPPISS